jgi:alpha 1,2-mannosyltransferase
MTGRNNTGHNRYTVLKASLIGTRRALPNMDVVVFHEDYTDEDIRNLPSGIVFEKIDFTGFEDIYNCELPSSRGYLMMCRFFSGIVQTHPKLLGYTHYIRMDDDSYFLEPFITEDLIEQYGSSDYVYRSVFNENKPQQSLYEFTMRFIDRRMNILQKIQIKKALVSTGVINNIGQYTGMAPYNNFHMSSLRLWSHPLVRSYIEAIERSGGIFRYGWLDANIHAMIVFIFPYIIPELSVRSCTSFGYRHNCHVSNIGDVGIFCDETLPFYPNLLDTTILPSR